MITVYINDSNKKQLGFAFYLFENEKYVIDYNTFDSSLNMQYYLEKSKCDLLGINLERFLSFCKDHVGNSIASFLFEEAVDKIQKAIKWRAGNRDKYEKFLNLVDRGREMLKTICDSVSDEEHSVRARMMYEIMIQFVDDELKK